MTTPTLTPTHPSSFRLFRTAFTATRRLLADARYARAAIANANAAHQNAARAAAQVEALERALPVAIEEHATALGNAETVEVAALAADASVAERVRALTA